MRKALALSAVVCIAGGVGVSLRADTARGASLAIRRQAPLSARVVQRDGASDQMVVVSESHGVPWNTLLARTPDPSGASAPKRVGKPTSHGRSPVGLSLSVGFGNSFRALTMVPVRVTARNRTAATI
ncbi:MAG TPA: hypothetical protein VG815_13435, partial [Chloroflexota bacterium]|nr:hypothetical protein [Chloroflexota bacterium]